MSFLTPFACADYQARCPRTEEGSASRGNSESTPANPDPNDNQPTQSPLSAKDLKKLSPTEIRKLENGGEDVHELKGGRGAASKFDLYKDKDGRVYVVRKGGVGEPDPTNLNIKHF